MSTHSTTTVLSGKKDSPILCKIYCQYDGYISGHGYYLRDNFGQTEIINGFSDENAGDYANGMGCFAAQVVERLKNNQLGNVYMTTFDDIQEYNYVLYQEEDEVYVTVTNEDGTELYDGPLQFLEE